MESPAASDASPQVEPGPAAAGAILRPALLLWLVMQVVVGLQAQLWAFAWRPDTEPGVGTWSYEIGYHATSMIVLLFVWRDAEARRIFARPRRHMVELCVLVGITAALLLSMWERQIPGEWFSVSPIELEHAAQWPLWACLLSSAVMPAVFEELMYRGLLLQRFCRVVPVGLAVATQAMLFATMHWDQVMLLPHFVFGVVAGILRLAAGALWPCMLMHCLWNGYIVLQVYQVL